MILGILASCQEEKQAATAPASEATATPSMQSIPASTSPPARQGLKTPTPASAAPRNSRAEAAAAAAASAAAASPTGPTPRKIIPARAGLIRIAYVPNIASMPVYVDQKTGWFRDHGVEVEYLDPVRISREALFLLGRGECEAAFGVNLHDAISAEMRAPGTLRIVEFAAEATSQPLCGFVVRADSAIKSLDDLKDKTLGVEGDDWGVMVAHLATAGAAASAAAGGSQAPKIAMFPAGMEVEPGEAGGPEAIFAAGWKYARLTRRIGPKGNFRVLNPAPLAAANFSPFPMQVTVVRAALGKSAPETVQKFATAADDLMRHCNKTYPEPLPWMQKALGFDDETALNLNPPVFLAASEIPAEQLDRAAQVWMRGANVPPMQTMIFRSSPQP